MKECPKCNKRYDDSWGICLSCNVKLVPFDPSVSNEVRVTQPIPNHTSETSLRRAVKLLMLVCLGIAATYAFCTYFHNYFVAIDARFSRLSQSNASFNGLIIAPYFFDLRLSYVAGFYTLMTAFVANWQNKSWIHNIIFVSLISIVAFIVYYAIGCVFISHPHYTRIQDVFLSGFQTYESALTRLAIVIVANIFTLRLLRKLSFLPFCCWAFGIYLLMDVLAESVLVYVSISNM
jgi:hypothetical protein